MYVIVYDSLEDSVRVIYRIKLFDENFDTGLVIENFKSIIDEMFPDEIP